MKRHSSSKQLQNGEAQQQPSWTGGLSRILERFSHHATVWTGSTWAFSLAVTVILIWGITGPLFGFSDTWQLVINTGTTIITFLMVFLIQRTQNKESLALQIKLDELLASQPGASNRLINVEDWDEEQIKGLHEQFASLTERLKKASDDGESHSVAEAQAALDDAHQVLRKVQSSRRDKGKAASSKQARQSRRAKST